MKIWISKYALSRGITEHECDPPEGESYYIYPGKPFASFVGFELGKDAHTNQKWASEAAETARIKRIAALRKQLVRLEKMVF